jgi:hypothetical protein
MYKVARSSHRPAPFKQRPPARWGIAGIAARRDGAWCLGKFRGSWEKLESDLYGVTGASHWILGQGNTKSGTEDTFTGHIIIWYIMR